MIILIGGDTHTGKTHLSGRLVQQTGYSCLSLDHLKMGLIRGLPHCPFTALDEDEHISKHLWPVTEGMIRTCSENGQHHILEGCYLPPDKVAALQAEYPGRIIAVYLGFTQAYLQTHFHEICAHENVVEQRLCGMDADDLARMQQANEALQQTCAAYGLPFFAVDQNYLQERRAVLQYILQNI